MNQTMIFWPMLAHVTLVYIVYAVMAKRRYGSVFSGEARASQFRGRNNEPERSVTVANNLLNQFELPVLFHVLCLALYVTNGVSYLSLTLMWIFVILRYAHAWVHLTSNHVLTRSRVFTSGAIILLFAWILFALHLANLI